MSTTPELIYKALIDIETNRICWYLLTSESRFPLPGLILGHMELCEEENDKLLFSLRNKVFFKTDQLASTILYFCGKEKKRCII